MCDWESIFSLPLISEREMTSKSSQAKQRSELSNKYVNEQSEYMTFRLMCTQS